MKRINFNRTATQIIWGIALIINTIYFVSGLWNILQPNVIPKTPYIVVCTLAIVSIILSIKLIIDTKKK